MQVWHMSGAGNDFMVVDARGKEMDFQKMALELCKLTGADGFMAVDYAEDADFTFISIIPMALVAKCAAMVAAASAALPTTTASREKI